MQKYFSQIAKKLVMIWLLLWMAGTIAALENTSPYEVELSTKTEGKYFDQTRSLQEALQSLLVKLCGSDKILQMAGVSKTIAEPEKYVTQFSYHQRPSGERYMKVLFNENKINQLLSDLHQAPWQGSRPLILMWLVMERKLTHTWLTEDSDNALVQAFEKKLTERGIPFVLPMLDLADTDQVKEQDVVNETLPPLLQGSARYNPDVIVLGRLALKDNVWQGQWTIVKGEEKISWNNSGADLSAFLNTAAEDLSEKLSGRSFEIKSASDEPEAPVMTNRFTIGIAGIISSKQYAAALSHLQRLPGVTHVEVIEIMPDKTLFELQTTGTEESLRQAISAKALLMESTESAPESLPIYRMRGVE